MTSKKSPGGSGHILLWPRGKKQLKVVSAEQACNRERFLPKFEFYPEGKSRPGKLNSRYVQMHDNALYAGYCACRKKRASSE